MTTGSCHAWSMTDNELTSSHQDVFARIKDVRARAIEHTIIARQLSAERRSLMESLLEKGVSQAQIARELGVSRQAIQKMLAC